MDEYDLEPIHDEYDRDLLESAEDGGGVGGTVSGEAVYTWDVPGFDNIQAWVENEPDDEFLGSSRDHTSNSRADIRAGSIFASKEDAIYCLQKYHILNRAEYRVKESEKTFMVLECRGGSEECPWRVRLTCKKNRNYWEVTKYKGDHVCRNRLMMRDNVHLNVNFIAREVVDVMSVSIRLTIKEIVARIHKDYGYEISYLKGWQAKHKALDLIFGTWEESFANLPQLLQSIQDTNPGTVVEWDRSPGPHDDVCVVNRVFWAFGPSIEAYPYCRPILSIDGTHLYGRYNGKILVACGLDANNHIMPIAFALVESENNSSWIWFMRCIRESVTDRDNLCVLSDRHAGILAALREPEWAPPRAYHRYCVRHFVSNFSNQVRDGTLKKKLNSVAYQRQRCKFDAEMKDLLVILESKPRARDWLVQHDPKFWSLAYDEGGIRYGSMTTNASECFNKILKDARDLPICAFVLFSFRQTNKWFCKRKESYQSEALTFSPKIEARLASLSERAYFHSVRMFNRVEGVFEVTTAMKHHVHTVNISERYCSCGKWTTFKFPCSHVLAVCKDMRMSHDEHVDYYFTMSMYYQTWHPSFNPLGDDRYWPTYDGPRHVPNPGFMRCSTGRPPTRRRHNEMDRSQPSGEGSSSGARNSRVQHCKICGALGHNRRSCPARGDA